MTIKQGFLMLSVNLLTVVILTFFVVFLVQSKKSKSADPTLSGRDLAALHYNSDGDGITVVAGTL
jgi:hypothetical protein